MLRHRSSRLQRHHLVSIPLCALAFVLCPPPPSRAAATLGFIEDWSGNSTNGWSGSLLITFSNPGTGGLGGASDGFLHVSLPTRGHLGARSIGPEYQGDWPAAGITQVRVWLNDVGADDPLEIHFSLGGFNNHWQYNIGFLPPENAWAEFAADLTDSNLFTHTILLNGQFFDSAMRNVQVVHLRHDKPPFFQIPDSISGDFGIDRLILGNGSIGIRPPGTVAPRHVELGAPYPNPSRGAVALDMVAPEGPVRLEVVDVQGRLVRRAELPAGTSGHRLWVWDGLDDRGRLVPAGSYRVRATGAGGGTSRPLVRVD